MAISDQQKNEILKIVAGLFNGAPGGGILNELATEVAKGAPIHEIARLLAETHQFKELTADKTTTAQQVEFLLNNFGLAPGGEPGSAAGLAEEYFTQRIEEGASLGHIVYEAIHYLQGDPLPVFADTIQLLDNKVQIASVHADNYAKIDSVEEGLSVLNDVISAKTYTLAEILESLASKLGGNTGGGDGKGDGDGDGDGKGDGDPLPPPPPPPARTFTVNESEEGVITFGGTATGPITFATDENVATFTRGNITATTKPALDDITQVTLTSGQTLSGTAAELAKIGEIGGAGNLTITGAPTVAEIEAINFSNVGSATYSLSDSLANLEAAEADLIAGATSYEINDIDSAFSNVAVDDLPNADQQALIDGASNKADFAYTLFDTLVKLVGADEGVVSGAESYRLSDEVDGFTDLPVAQAEIVAGADNANEYTYSLLDTLENLTNANPEILSDAASYTLSDEALTAEDLTDVTVDGLAGQQAAAITAVRENDIVAGATNGDTIPVNHGTYTLADTLANLAGAADDVISNAASYSLTDSAGLLNDLTIAEAGIVAGASNSENYTYSLSNDAGSLGVLSVAEASIVAGASDAEDYTYSISDTWENINNPDAAAIIAGAESYEISNIDTAFQDVAVAGLPTAEEQALINDADNAGDYTYSLTDTLANLADASLSIVFDAQSYTISDIATAFEDVAVDGLPAGAQKTLIDDAANTGDYAYSLVDTLENLVAAEEGVVSGAESHTLTDAAGLLNDLTIAEAEIVAGADNANEYTYSLLDTLENLTNANPEILSDAASYTLSDEALTAEDLTDVTVDGLAGQQAAAITAVRENDIVAGATNGDTIPVNHGTYTLADTLANLAGAADDVISDAASYRLSDEVDGFTDLPVAQAEIVAGADNANEYTYSLLDTLENLTNANPEILSDAASYTLSDEALTAEDLTDVTVDGLAGQQAAAITAVRENDIVAGATNGDTIPVNHGTYTLADTLANLAGAADDVISDAASYRLSDEVDGFTDLPVAQAEIVAGADNANEYTYSLLDTLENLTNANPEILSDAASYTLSDEALTAEDLTDVTVDGLAGQQAAAITAVRENDIVAGATNGDTIPVNHGTYTLADTLANLAGAADDVISDAASYRLSDEVDGFTDLPVAQAEIVAGADNANEYTYSLLDTLENLTNANPEILSDAASYTLSDEALTAEDLTDVTVDGLAGQQAAAITAVRENDIVAGATNGDTIPVNHGTYTLADTLANLAGAADDVISDAASYRLSDEVDGFTDLPVAQAEIVAGADNANEYTYSLLDTLENLTNANPEILSDAASYTLSDEALTAEDLTDVTVDGLAGQQAAAITAVRENDIVAGATNGDTIPVNHGTYTLADTLANLAGAADDVISDAASYRLSDEVDGFTDLPVAQAEIVAGADNANEYTYSLLDTLENLTNANPEILSDAASYTLSDEALTAEDLTDVTVDGLAGQQAAAITAVRENDIVAGATNGDTIPVNHGTYTLADTLANLAGAADDVISDAASYRLSDEVDGFTDLPVAQAEIVAGADNANEYTYSLLDTLENLTNANPEILSDAASYTLSDEALTAEDLTDVTVDGLAGQQAAAITAVRENDIVAGATNGDTIPVNHGTYTLADTLANLAGAADDVISNAASYSLTDSAGLLNDLTIAEAGIVAGASNSENYTYSLSNDAGSLGVLSVAEASIVAGASDAEDYTYSISDTWENINNPDAAAIIAGAESYEISNIDTAFQDVAVAGLPTAEEQALINDADNAGDYTYSLTDTLANLADASLSIVFDAQSYTISDIATAFEDVAVDGLPAGAQKTLIDDAANTGDYAYSLVDTLENLVAAEEGVVSGAESHTLTDAAGLLNDLTIAEAEIVAGADNANEYTYSLLDTLENLTNANPEILSDAASYTLSDEALTAEDLTDVTVDGLAGQQAAAITAVRENDIVAGATNGDTIPVNHGTYTLADTLANLAGAADDVISDAASYRLSDEVDGFTDLPVAQAEIVAGADNANEYTYSLLDTLENLTNANPEILSDAASYTLSDEALTAEDLTDVTVDGLAGQQAAAITAVRENDIVAGATNGDTIPVNHGTYTLADTLANLAGAADDVISDAASYRLSDEVDGFTDLPVAQAEIVAGADNANEYTYSLLDTLENLTNANPEILSDAASYTLSDEALTAEDLTDVTVDGLAGQQAAAITAVRENDIVAGATNGDTIPVNHGTYTLADTLANLAGAADDVISDAASYRLSDEVDGFTDLPVAQAEIVAGADNANEYTYSLLDTLENLTNANPEILSDAASYTLSDEALTAEDLTDVTVDGLAGQQAAAITAVRENDIVAGATNGDTIPVNHGTYTLADTLANLAGAADDVISDAASYRLSDEVDGFTDLPVAQAEIVAGADNANEYTYSLLDTLENLTNANPEILSDAASYTLSDEALTAEDLTDVTVDGLAGQQAAAITAVRENDIVAGATNGDTIPVNHGTYTLADTLANLAGAADDVISDAASYRLSDEVDGFTDLPVAQAEIVAGADNANEYTYSLLDTLENLTNANPEILSDAASYTLSDEALTAEDLTDVTVDGLAGQQAAAITAVRENDIVAGATNGDTIPVNHGTYTLADTLANLAGAADDVISDAASYRLSDEVDGFTDLPVAQAEIVAGADNANEYTYSLLDTLENLTNANPEILSDAASYTLSDEALTAEDLTDVTVDGLAGQQAAAITAVRENDIVAGATNGDTIPVNHGTYTLADTLANLAGAADDVISDAASYRLSDEVDGFTDLPVAQAEIVAGADNANEYTYSLLDTLENLTNANPEILSDAASYTLSDEALTAEDLTDVTVDGLAGQQAAAITAVRENDIVAGATNGDTIPVNHGTYTLADTLANLAGAADDVISNAASYSLSDEVDGFTDLPVAQAEIVAGAENVEDYPYSINDTAAAIDAANANILNGATAITATGTAGDDNVDLSGVETPVTIDLGDGDDIFVGGDGGDIITGGKGADVITLGSGADTVVIKGGTSLASTSPVLVQEFGDADLSLGGAITFKATGTDSRSLEFTNAFELIQELRDLNNGSLDLQAILDAIAKVEVHPADGTLTIIGMADAGLSIDGTITFAPEDLLKGLELFSQASFESLNLDPGQIAGLVGKLEAVALDGNIMFEVAGINRSLEFTNAFELIQELRDLNNGSLDLQAILDAIGKVELILTDDTLTITGGSDTGLSIDGTITFAPEDLLKGLELFSQASLESLNLDSGQIVELVGKLKAVELDSDIAFVKTDTHNITFNDADDLIAQLENLDVVDSAEFDSGTNTLTIVGKNTGAGESLNITNVADLFSSVGVPAATEAVNTEASGADSTIIIAADSNASDMDSIHDFDLAADKLSLDVTTILDDSALIEVPGGGSLSVTDGIASVAAGDPELDDVLLALVTQMGDEAAAVAYYDGNDTYVFQGDGVAGLQDSDVVVQLVGVEVTDLGNILG